MSALYLTNKEVAQKSIPKFRKASVMALSSTQLTGITFTELRPEKKKLITKN